MLFHKKQVQWLPQQRISRTTYNSNSYLKLAYCGKVVHNDHDGSVHLHELPRSRAPNMHLQFLFRVCSFSVPADAPLACFSGLGVPILFAVVARPREYSRHLIGSCLWLAAWRPLATRRATQRRCKSTRANRNIDAQNWSVKPKRHLFYGNHCKRARPATHHHTHHLPTYPSAQKALHTDYHYNLQLRYPTVPSTPLLLQDAFTSLVVLQLASLAGK